MKAYGFEVPEDKRKDFEKEVLENYKTVSDYDEQEKELNAANEKIKANNDTITALKKDLKEFKDVDVSALNQKIEDLEKQNQTIEDDYKAKLADRDFNDILKESISAAHGINAKAITALLDIDTLKASKNQKEDIAAAIKNLTEAEDSKMLFGEGQPKVTKKGSPIGDIGGGSGEEEKTSLKDALKDVYKE